MGVLPKTTKRRDLIKRFRELGWDGPYSRGGKHKEHMVKGAKVVKLPNPHSKRGDIGEPLLKELLKQASISPEQWVDGG